MDDSTVPVFHAIEINALALDVTRLYALAAARVAVKFLLPCLSFGVYIAFPWYSTSCSHESPGVLLVLSLTSVYFLMRETYYQFLR